MEYFTSEEAERIIEKGPIFLCALWPGENPAIEQARALYEHIKTDRYCQDEPLWAAACGFILGRATGIREERQRRKGGQA